MTPRVFLPLLIVLTTSVCIADELSHAHKPVVYPSPPVISRLKVSYATPSRIVIAKDGSILVADTRAGVIFQTTVDGVTSIRANGLKKPVSVVSDKAGNAFVLTRGDSRTGSGAIYQVTPEGDRVTVHDDLDAPSDFVRDEIGNSIITLPESGLVIKIDPDGQRRTLTRDVPKPIAIAKGPNGELFVASSKGSVFQVLPTGAVRELAGDLKSPADLAIGPNGGLVIADIELGHLTVVAKGGKKRYASVPKGTAAVAFDAAGNMVIANKHLQSVTRVTTRMSIPCPHCDGAIPVVLKRPTARRDAF